MKKRLALLLFCLLGSTSHAARPVEGGLYEKLKLDRVIGVRVLRLPKGDNSADGAVTFVSSDPKICQTIDDSLRRLPMSGSLRRSSAVTPKIDFRRRVMLINSDGREASLLMDDDRLLDTFKNEGHAAKFVAAIKQVENDAAREAESLEPFPAIDAVVTHRHVLPFPNAGAGLIRVGDRVTIDLAKLTTGKSSARLNFTSKADPDRRGWLMFPSAMSCQRVTMNYRDKIHDAGFRLMSQHLTVNLTTRIDVLALGRKRDNVKYEVSIMQIEGSFIRGYIRLEGRPAENVAEAKPEAE